MPKRLPYEILIFGALTLGSCDGPGLSEKQRDEVSDIAGDGAVDPEEFRKLESRVEEIESKLNM
jgi:hypothetical protein